MPAGAAPAGSGVGELASSVRLPPLTANAPTAPIRLSSTYRFWPSGLRRASTGPAPPVALTAVLPSSVSAPLGAIEYREMLLDPVLVVNRNWPSWVISIQHGAVCRSANGEDPIADSVPSAGSLNAETVPLPAPLWALDTNSCSGSVGRNSLPNGPRPWAAKGDPGAAVSSPPEPTVKLSIWDVPMRVPTSLVPLPLNSTSPGWEPSDSTTVEPAMGARRPSGLSRNPV